MKTYKLPVRFDTANAMDISSEIDSIVCKDNYLILDFSDCEYMASMGMRILVKSKKILTSKGGELFLANLNETVLGVLKMAGLASIIPIVTSVEEANEKIASMHSSTDDSITFDANGMRFHYSKIAGAVESVSWNEISLAGYEELSFAVGNGYPAEEARIDPSRFNSFFSLGSCVGFLNLENPAFDDYRIYSTSSEIGVYLSEALSFGQSPSGYFSVLENGDILLSGLIEASTVLKEGYYKESTDEYLCIVVESCVERCSIHCALVTSDGCSGGCFLLDEWRESGSDNSLSALLSNNLTIDNIAGIKPLNLDVLLSNPVCYLFMASRSCNFKTKRLIIEAENEFELYKGFLARRIYTDSAKISIRMLHGGYSAQTYQVESFDTHGRRMRPTVMKVADRNMIERESERCLKNAMPYILNNSAQIIGTQFFGGMGALRYNFVGIGGGKTHLKWLTKYYQEESFEVLEPIFDKVFVEILEPWYGQAVRKRLNPYLDHDPTLTFFPHIYKIAEEVLGIDASQEFIFVEELDREMLNPYWFLKNCYPKRRSFSIDYYSAICHGDLNMQNILVDENMNIYLIDFSETKMRCAVSDFARLEVIMMIDNSPCSTEEEYKAYCNFILPFYERFSSINPSNLTVCDYHGPDRDFVEKNLKLVRKLRRYAFDTVHGDDSPIPYYFPFLEWCLPIVCYGGLSLNTRRLSMIISGLICEKTSNHFK